MLDEEGGGGGGGEGEEEKGEGEEDDSNNNKNNKYFPFTRPLNSIEVDYKESRYQEITPINTVRRKARKKGEQVNIEPNLIRSEI